MAVSCGGKEKAKIDDAAFMSCVQANPEVNKQQIFFDKLRVTFEKRGFSLTHPDSKKYYAILRSRIEGHDRGTLRDDDIDLKALCECDYPPAFEKPDVVDPAIQCLVSGLPPDKADQVRKVLSHDANEKQIKSFIDNYEDGPAKTYVLTLLLFRTTI
ncbi:MAG TPA: hypothetical protein VFE50_09150 [Cyclobacteriaceae bacterium]|nr:hypothetical protein [Cyclobacteriaceae bacterium]